MFGFFKRKKADDEPEVMQGGGQPEPQRQEPSRFAKGTQIRYDEGLVDKLKDDHQKLLGLYTEISSLADAGQYERLQEKLSRFRVDLTDHLLNENVKLYVFLDRSMVDDEMNSELIRSFRREMDGIGKTVMDFLRRYQLHGVNDTNVDTFRDELVKIGEVLGDRITREESTLYVMYEQI